MVADISPEEARKLLREFEGQPIKEDTFAQGLIGAPTGIASILDIPGQLVNLGLYGAEKIGNKLGSDIQTPRIPAYATEGIRALTNKLAGEPQTEMGAKGRQAGEFLGSFISPAHGTGIRPLTTARGAINAASGVNPAKYEAFKAAGITPTLGEISNSRATMRGQELLRNMPLAAGRFEKIEATREQQLENLFKQFGEIEKALTPEQTKALTSKGGKAYNKKAKDVASKLYDRAWKNVDDYAEVPLYKTREAIANELSAITPEARKVLKDSTGGKALEKLQDAIINNGGKLPFGDLKKVFKSDLSDLVNTFGQVGTAEQGKLKHIIGTLDKEMGDYIRKTNPKAAKDLDKADKFWSQYSERNKDIANLASKEADPIKIFNSNLVKLKKGDTQPTKVIMQRLDPIEREQYSATMINELGSGANGEFDPMMWSRNFNKLRPESQKMMMSGLSKEQAEKLPKISEALEHVKFTKGQGNPSGSAYTGALVAMIMGGPTNAAKLGGAFYGGSHLFTNPLVIDALYAASKTRTQLGFKKVIDKYLPDITAQMSRIEALKQQNEISPEEARQLLMQMEQSR